jgi:uncharacterized protein YjbI with pentapeptide repeats
VSLVPNGPRQRIEHVIRTYRNTKSAFVVIDAIEVALAIMGYDRESTSFARANAPLWEYLFTGEGAKLAREMQAAIERRLTLGRSHPSWMKSRTSEPDALGAYVKDAFDSMSADVAAVVPGVNEPHRFDILIPWAARELGRAAKELRRGRMTDEDYELVSLSLSGKGPAIGMWALQERIDLSRTTLLDALQGIENFQVEGADRVPQGTVVFELDGGYTIQELTTEEQLIAEGEAVQNCVGDGAYWDSVEEGSSKIYSLRDRRGRPHVTIEWQVSAGTFSQIRGKQNTVPDEKYRPMLKRFVSERFDGNPLGLLMVAMPGEVVEFAGSTVTGVDFTIDWQWGGVPVSQASFAEATLDTVHFGHLEGVSFEGATLTDCRIESPEDCSFEGAKLTRCRFVMNIDGCNLSRAGFAECEMTDIVVDNTSLVASSWLKCGWDHVDFLYCDLSDVLVHTGGFIRDVRFTECTFDRFRVVPALAPGAFRPMPAPTQISNVAFRDVDLRSADRETLRQFYHPSGVYRYVQWPPGFKAEMKA